MTGHRLQDHIFTVDETSFTALALEIFRFQLAHNPVYAAFSKGLGKNRDNVNSTGEIPFLPVELFKSHRIYSAEKDPQIVFTSSGTTGSVTSRHEVADVSLYEKSFLAGFEKFYGPPGEWTILALLPSYLEREGSSLVYMADRLIRESKSEDSGFYLHNYKELSGKLSLLNRQKKKTLLLGVTYALLDLAEQFPQPLENITIMETGGMKGKRKEMVREEVHAILEESFHVKNIHSEYGMTELLSQAYSSGGGIFRTPPWMKILIREMNDPLSFCGSGRTGGVNIIDLANLYSCSFIATSDLGKIHGNNSFEILGRFDFSDVRGCNLMVE
ncbi:MAG TPA: acyl transferase [Bacteroidia bacterium]|nr:acyl transferase [Bacteroidia bacterium]